MFKNIRAGIKIAKQLRQNSEFVKDLIRNSKSASEINTNLCRKYTSFVDINDFLTRLHYSAAASTSLGLDLGSGKSPRNLLETNKMYGVDVCNVDNEKVFKANLSVEKIPFEDSLFDVVTAFDFIEHIPRILSTEKDTIYPFVLLMNEVYRVLKPGGLFVHKTPAFPSKQAFQDPTHVNIITEDTFPIYFCNPQLLAKEIGYGYHGSFQLVLQGWIDNAWILCAMKKCIL